MSWFLGYLHEIADIIPGYAFKSEWFGEKGKKVVRIGDLQNGYILDKDIVYFDDHIHQVSDQFRIKKGDILMALSGATVGKTAVAQEKDINSYANQRIAIIRGKTFESSNFIKYLFSGSALKKLLTSAGGAAQPNLSPKDLSNMEIPLPPLEEQKRIATILDKADTIRRKRQQAIQLADQFLRSVFLEMFGDPATNPKSFPKGTIRDLVDTVTYGTSNKASTDLCSFPILRMGNITYEGGWDLSDLKYIDLTDTEQSKFLVSKGDLLFNRTNSKELVGKAAVFDLDLPMAYAGYLIRVRTNLNANNYYIAGYLNSKHGKQTLQSICKSIVGMANINAQELQNIEILIPPKALQDKYANIQISLKQKIANLLKSQEKLDNLFASLSCKAFSGTL